MHEVPCEVKMANDVELDRLKSVQDRKFMAKQRAFEAQDSAWKLRSAARDRLSTAYDEKQRAYEVQNSAWEQYQAVRSSLGSRIDSLKNQQERAFQNMKRAFDSASSAHASKDGASARRYADEGHSYKAEAQACTAERRGLVDQIRAAKNEFERHKAPFQAAKARFDSVKREFEQAKAKHEQAKAEFQRTKADFQKAKMAFAARLDKLKAEATKRREDRKSIAVKAGVPSQYVENVWIRQDGDGNYNIYFGGIGKPDGEGHGHYVMSASGKITYRREPFDPHGSHNFQRDSALESRLTDVAVAAALEAQAMSGPRSDQYHDGHVSVKVKSGYDVKSDQPVTDVIVIDREHPQEHLHVVLSATDGKVIFSEWRKNH